MHAGSRDNTRDPEATSRLLAKPIIAGATRRCGPSRWDTLKIGGKNEQQEAMNYMNYQKRPQGENWSQEKSVANRT